MDCLLLRRPDQITLAGKRHRAGRVEDIVRLRDAAREVEDLALDGLSVNAGAGCRRGVSNLGRDQPLKNELESAVAENRDVVESDLRHLYSLEIRKREPSAAVLGAGQDGGSQRQE